MPAINAPVASFRLLPEDAENLATVARALPSVTGRPYLTSTDAFRAALRVAAQAVAEDRFAATLATYRATLGR